ncbi:RNA-binding S4 domain-containing protein [Chakrabartyella piscis]|uniref:RNA-binding S4 domain-containing protein n=1 Tax=Chakrabartyella piscis TaxID=2918914 RepID=UPI002958CD21|nr:RNA-binding S4 domain-containing protein [Chakrabartyella piscis]
METVAIHTEFIKLQQILKLGGLVGQGSDVKILLAEGVIYVNGVVATERGKKIRVGDVVEYKGVGSITVVGE